MLESVIQILKNYCGYTKNNSSKEGLLALD
jgi:hypothetical protein